MCDFVPDYSDIKFFSFQNFKQYLLNSLKLQTNKQYFFVIFVKLYIPFCLMGLTDSPLCRKFGAEDKTSAHILCRCEALVSIRQAHLGPFFLEPEDVKSQTLGAIWRFSKADGLPWKMVGAQMAGIKGLGASGLRAPNPHTNQSINQSSRFARLYKLYKKRKYKNNQSNTTKFIMYSKRRLVSAVTMPSSSLPLTFDWLYSILLA
jgi:hypothetical protein